MLADRVLHTTTTTGTGSYDLIDPSSALYLSAVSSVGSGNRLTYAVEFGSSWELCWGVVTAGSPATLTRNLIRSSTGALINWGAGTKTLYSISQADIVRFGGRGSLPTSAGTANAQTLAHVTPLRSLQAGMEIVFIPGATNTGATTLAVDSLGAITILAPGGAACVGGELRSGVPAQAIYDGTSWRLVSYSPSATGASLLAAADAAAARTAIGAAANPTTGPGVVGTEQVLNSGTGSSLTAPSGGTWICKWQGFNNATGAWLSPWEIGEVAGGTTLKAGSSGVIYIGFAYRKA